MEFYKKIDKILDNYCFFKQSAPTENIINSLKLLNDNKLSFVKLYSSIKFSFHGSPRVAGEAHALV